MRGTQTFNILKKIFLVSTVVCLIADGAYAETKAGKIDPKKTSVKTSKITESECTAKSTGTVIKGGCLGVADSCRWFENGEFHSECISHLPTPK
jgi:hypothetical protein